MAETLGSLCDKLSIVKLKEWHSTDEARLKSLAVQSTQLIQEIDTFVADACCGKTPHERLAFSANKVYKEPTAALREIHGTIGQVVEELAKVNCELWHKQEKVYDFSNLSQEEMTELMHALAKLNLERNKCIDAIDHQLIQILKEFERDQ